VHIKLKEQVPLLALILELCPVAAFFLMRVLSPSGDPQMGPPFVRFLDFQGSFWIRNEYFFPPPLLAIGFAAAVYSLYAEQTRARIPVLVGGLLLAIWLFILWRSIV